MMADASLEPVTMMKQVVSVGYAMRPSPIQARYAKEIAQRRIVGHKCPECGLVYVPPRGYCGICVVETTWERDAVQVTDKGTVTSFTVVTPVQYPGQEEKDVYVVASILLDGASMTLGQQRVGEIAPEDVRTGLRVEAEWASAGDGKGFQIKHWGPCGEPDVPIEELADHVL